MLLASLEERSTCGELGCFLGAENGDNFKGVLVDETARDEFALFWEAAGGPKMKAFPCFQE